MRRDDKELLIILFINIIHIIRSEHILLSIAKDLRWCFGLECIDCFMKLEVEKKYGK